jgi:predicted dehydrogenase/threonine dehydrogenase-like Zn-dependent dehydrogenase
MKQLLQNLRTGQTVVEDVPIPNPQKGEALVRTATSLLSAGTERMLVEFAGKSLVGKARSRPDLMRQVIDKARREGLLSTLEAAFSRLDQPMPLGYSSAGRVVALGENMTGFEVGQRVACAGGGYAVHAEYVCVPANLLAALPDEVDYESAAFTTLGAIAMHGFRQADVQLGEKVAVIGLGLLGLLAVIVARAAGCQVFGVDLDPKRVALAEGLGARAVSRDQAVEAAISFSRGRGCDAVLICADTPSADPVELAGAIARDRAHVVAVGAVGLQLPRKVYYEKELTFLNSRSYGPGRYDPRYEEKGADYPVGYVRWTEGRNLEAFVDLLAEKAIDVHGLITHRFPIDRAPEAYDLITAKKNEPFLGVLLTYPETDKELLEPIPAAAQKTQFSKPEVTHQITGQDQKVRLGMLGAGNFAIATMLPSIHKIPSLELVGVASASGMNARHAAERFGFRYASGDEIQILDDPHINTIAVLTRHNLHARQVTAALNRGKNVFCEKPLGLNEKELADIQQALFDENQAGERKPLLMVGFNRRFAPLAIRMKDFLDERREPLFAHYRVNAGFIPANHWTQDPEIGGGRIIGEGCHFVDFLTFLVGEPPRSVSARSLPDVGRYSQDNVVMSFVFPDGSIGVVSYLANGDRLVPKESVEAFCSGRVALLNDFRTVELVCNGKRRTYSSRLRQDKGHQAEWKAFSEAILMGNPPPIPYEQIFGVMQATFAVQEALRTGTTIKIDIGGKN